MRKEIYELVDNVLFQIKDENNEPLIKHFDLFNQQILFITQERPFATPAVFIDFNRIEWNYLSHGVREANVTFNLYVVVDSTTAKYSDSLEVFTLHDIITEALWNAEPEEDTNRQIGTITLQSNTTDNECDELRADVDTYICHVIDGSTPELEALHPASDKAIGSVKLKRL